MLRIEFLKNLNCTRVMKMLVPVVFSAASMLPLIGCGANENSGPVVSSLSSPSVNNVNDSISNLPSEPIKEDPAVATESPAVPPGDMTTSFPEGLAPHSTEPDPLLLDSDEESMTPMTPTQTGATVHLAWDHSPDPNVTGYYIHYGKQPSEQLGLCSYEQSQAIEAPPATITGLDPNTPYFFAISAFSESESPCSIEVMLVTPPVGSGKT
jgi:hypothetical protein